jgi:hypothetical protein
MDPLDKSRAAPDGAGNGSQSDRLGSAITTKNNGWNIERQRAAFVERHLALFGARCRELAERVDAGLIGFIEAVDMLYSASVWSGLSDSVGDDAVQAVMARAFMGLRRP